MSGTAVIVAKLKASSDLIAVVPAARIKPGDLPQGTLVPAISVTKVGGSQRSIVNRQATNVFRTDRIRVSVLVAGQQTSAAGTGYPGLEAIMALVLAACPQTRGTVNGVAVDSITPDTEGPDLTTSDPVQLSRTIDFVVCWTD